MRKPILLESAPVREKRGVRGAFASFAIHAGLIGFAVYMTAQAAEPEPEPEKLEDLVYVAPPKAPEPRPQPPSPQPPRPRPPEPRPAPAPLPPTPKPIAPPQIAAPTEIPVSIPEPTFSTPAIDTTGAANAVTTASAGEAGDGAPDAGGPLESFAVDVEVQPRRGNPQPRYPEFLRQSRIEGAVQLEFVVGKNGRVEMNTIRVLQTPHDLFVDAVKNALARSRFTPAMVGGQAVRQLVRQEFIFTLA